MQEMCMSQYNDPQTPKRSWVAPSEVGFSRAERSLFSFFPGSAAPGPSQSLSVPRLPLCTAAVTLPQRACGPRSVPSRRLDPGIQGLSALPFYSPIYFIGSPLVPSSWKPGTNEKLDVVTPAPLPPSLAGRENAGLLRAARPRRDK